MQMLPPISYDGNMVSRIDKQLRDQRRSFEALLRPWHIGPIQFTVLEDLARVFNTQRADARFRHAGFRGGWTHVHTNDRVRLSTIQGLIRKGYVQACCTGHDGCDDVRITPMGLKLLEVINGS